MLVKQQTKLRYFIYFLALLLAALLIANSVLGSIYINSLKNRINNITDNYFVAEKRLQQSLEALILTRVDLANITTTFKLYAHTDEFLKEKNKVFFEYQKNEINLSSSFLDLKKQLLNINSFDILRANEFTARREATPCTLPRSGTQVAEQRSRKLICGEYNTNIDNLNKQITQYLLDIESLINSPNYNFDTVLESINQLLFRYQDIKHQLESLSHLLKANAANIKNSEPVILQYFPTIFFVSFGLALMIGSFYIYTARRQIRKSVLDQSAQLLTQAHQYQYDCIQTLEICREIANSGLRELQTIKQNSLSAEDKTLLNNMITNFEIFAVKVNSSFEVRSNLHKQEARHLEMALDKLT